MSIKLSALDKIVAVFLSVAAGQATAAAYTFIDLGTPGGTNSYASSINNSGQVVGWSYGSSNGPTKAILWNGTTATQLDAFGGRSSLATGINNFGQVIGNIDGYAAMWDGTTATPVGMPGGARGGAVGINDLGMVVGATFTGTTVHATMWTGVVSTDLDPLNPRDSYAEDINDAGQVVGGSAATGYFRATMWTGSTVKDLGTLGGRESYANAVNSAGQVVGYSWTRNTAGAFGSSNSSIHATLWDGTTVKDLGTLPDGTWSEAFDINSFGQVVGSATESGNNGYRAVIWNGTTATDLNSFLDVATVNAGWVLRDAVSINDSGSVVGLARNTILGEYHAFMLAANSVPEPETYTMVLAGLGLMGVLAGRRKSRRFE